MSATNMDYAKLSSELDDRIEPEVVYHYTSMETLLKIVEKPVIRATGVKYLNDTTEREHFLRLVLNRLPDFIREQQVTETAIFAALQERRYNNVISDIMMAPFVASFSEDSDSLNQWRSYCSNGNGVSIGFRTECLRAASMPATDHWLPYSPSVTFQKVMYLEETHIAVIDQTIANAMKAALDLERELRESDPKDQISSIDIFNHNIENKACFIKNPAFSNEREYRLLVSPLLMNYEFLQFRSSRSTLIPYVEVPIPPKATAPVSMHLAERLTRSDGGDFIDRIVIGPTPNSELSVDAVANFTRKHKLMVNVVASKVPFRDL